MRTHRAIAVLFALTLASSAHAAWLPQGTSLQVGAHGYRGAWIDADAQGGHVVRLRPQGNGYAYGAMGRVTSLGDYDATWGTTHVYEPGIAAPDGMGGYFLLELSGPSQGGSWPCALRHLTSTGVVDPAWPLGGVPLSDFVYAPGSSLPQLLADGAGGLFVSYEYWKQTLPQAWGVYIQHFTALGAVAPGWPAEGRRLSTDFPAITPEPLALDGAGGVYVLAVSTSGPFLVVHHILGTGAFDPNWTSSGIQIPYTPPITLPVRLVDHGAGEASAVWRTSDFGAGLNVLRFDSHLDQGARWLATRTLGSAVRWANVFDDGQGGLLALWQQTSPASDVRGLRWTSAGVLVPGWDNPNTSRLPAASVLDPQHDIAAAVAGAGGALLAWKDLRGGQDRLYMTRLLGDGTRHGSWSAGGDSVPISAGLHVTAPEATGYPLDVQLDESGRAYVAWHVGDYQYDQARLARLVVGAYLDAPESRPALAAPRVAPNPARGELNVAFALTDGGPARIELLDTSGRCLRSEEVGAGSGERQIRWSLGHSLPPGLYFVRLRHESASSTRRVSIVR